MSPLEKRNFFLFRLQIQHRKQEENGPIALALALAGQGPQKGPLEAFR